MPLPTQPKVQVDGALQRVQDNLHKSVQLLNQSPVAGSVLLTNQVLVAGLNQVGHGLAKPLTGWAVVRVHMANGALPFAWKPAVFQNSWVNFGGTFAAAAYMLDGNGVCWVEGLIKSGTSGTVAFALPTTCFPANGALMLPSVDGSNAGVRMDVSAAGLVYPGGAGGSINNDFFSTTCNFKTVSAPATPNFSDTQDSNATPGLTLNIVASAACTVDLLVF